MYIPSSFEELDDFLERVEALGNDDEMRAQWSELKLDERLLGSYPDRLQDMDPFSQEYATEVEKFFRYLFGKKYVVSNEIVDIDPESMSAVWFPYDTRSPSTVGNFLMTYGFIIRSMDLPVPSKILDIGSGSGSLTIHLARMGYELTCVDVNPRYLELLKRLTENCPKPVKFICADMNSLELEESYDAVLFMESFHHSPSPTATLERIKPFLNRKGKIFFAAEPVVPEECEILPYPWGPRLDGESLRAMRRGGWTEMGFTEDYFFELLSRNGLTGSRLTSTEAPWGDLITAHPAREFVTGGITKRMEEVRKDGFDLDQVLTRVRHVAASRGRSSRLKRLRALGPSRASEWNDVRELLDAAKGQADAAESIPAMTHRHWLIRPFARLVARLMMYLTQSTVASQAQYNRVVIQALDSLNANGFRLTGGLNDLGTRVAGQYEELRALFSELDLLEAEIRILKDELSVSSSELKKAASEFEKEQKAVIEEIRDRISEFGEVVERSLPAARINEEGLRAFEELYLSFEDSFRGTREEIAERQRVYLPFVQDVVINPDEDLVVDLGCGRAEWLQLLRDAGLRGLGIDSNHRTVEFCRELGFEVNEVSVLSYLRESADESIRVVTAFHLVEHLPLGWLVPFFHESARVLQKGGLLILETPNPENFVVGSSTFWLDPTHVKPLPKSLLTFFLRETGFEVVELLDLSQPDLDPRLVGNEVGEVLSEHLGASRDYGIVARKGLPSD